MSTLTENDEFLHQPDKRLKWRESYYFNWVDLENNVSGFTTIGILPNQKKREFVFLLFMGDDLKTVHYQEAPLEKNLNNIDKILTDNKLTYRLIVPLKLWKIILRLDEIEFDLDFETRFPLFDFGRNSSASWHGHFEASGIIKGSLKLADGTKKSIHGYGQRDKSWGYRDWHQFDKWYAGHIQFRDWAIGFRKDYYAGQIDLSGFLSTKTGNIPLKSLEIKTITEDDEDRTPLTSEYHITTGDGKVFIIETERLGKSTSFRFARDFPEGYTELFEQMVVMKSKTGETGTGMAEYLRTKTD